MGKGIDDGGANAQTGKRAGSGHKSDFGNILPGFVVFLEFIVNVFEEIFGEVATRIPLIDLIV